MLQKLELIGFKSFAERTAFEFAAGITAIVGPNGSGKSNVVDAVKWVLGEQSAKSLRGGGMADVIFNGSTSRRAHSQAEVSLTFDNSRGLLASTTAEVRIGRRVFRDGTSDYLINGVVCRLKDVRDLFLGTGAAAYSMIEQGRVDALLQASQDDRRAIFEEAAGVSRYKAKKIECLRRLERVDENVTRLQDILGEVDQQLKSVRLQAAKALRFQEHTARLKDLRLALGWRDYQAMAQQLESAEVEAANLRREIESGSAQLVGWSDRAAELESCIAAVAKQLHAYEQAGGDARLRVAMLQAAIQRDGELAERLNAENARDQTRRESLAQLMRIAAEEVERSQCECDNAERTVDNHANANQELAKQIDALDSGIASMRQAIEELKNNHVDQERIAARYHNEAVTVRAQIDQMQRERRRLTQRKAKAATALLKLDTELNLLRKTDAELENRLHQLREQVGIERHRREASTLLIAECQDELTRLRARAAGLASRVEVLSTWDQDPASVGAGVKYLLERKALAAKLGIVGWVPECLSTTRELAPLIDLALGSTAQFFVVAAKAPIADWLEKHAQSLPGRIGLLDLSYADANAASGGNLPSSVQRAAELVTCDNPDLARLPERLLGTTFVVDKLETAQELGAKHPGLRFVTRTGELLEPDGSAIVGGLSGPSGVFSRKSELIELLKESQVVNDRIADVDSELCLLEQAVSDAEHKLAATARHSVVLADQVADSRSRIAQQCERRAGLDAELRGLQDELANLIADTERNERQLQDLAAQAESAAAQAQQAVVALAQTEHKLREQVQEQLALHQSYTAAQIELARAKERLKAVHLQHRQLQSVASQRETELKALDEQIGDAEARIKDCCAARARSEEELAQEQDAAAAADRDRQTAAQQLASLRQELQDLRSHMLSAQDRWQRCKDDLHQRDLVVRDLTSQRNALTERLSEDYQIDVAAAGTAGDAPSLGDHTPEQAQIELDELRSKLQRLGHVNLESLEELKLVETKHEQMQKQFDDLSAARRSLEESINKINADSHRLFVETFTSVKGHFQDLFRRLFGGGMADVVLEKPDEPLESPIDIMARPPGKELRSIAQMSGGERTMTAVALLLAIFRSKPSPFCILDEVDAALDEANTARLTQVLREFASTSQFIVITHSKRTMAAADVLFGITMQESGVSKRVAVRFDEWPDDTKKAA